MIILKFKNFDYKFVNSWVENGIVDLYKSAGWWSDNYNSAGIQKLIRGSFAFLVIVDLKTDKTVGMGRLISDGVSDAYIQDVVILPDYRGLGLGKKLIEILVSKCIEKDIRWIGLIAEPGQENFYLKVGFDEMLKYVPMKYKI